MNFINLNKNKIQSYISSICPACINPNNQKTKVVYAPAQSGKTTFIITSSINSIMKNTIPIIIVRNVTADAKQLQTRYNEMIKNINEHLNLSDKLKINVYQAINIKKKEADNSRLINSIKNAEPIVIICLANCIQTKRLEFILEECKNECKYELYIDEVDAVCYSKSTTSSKIERIKENATTVTGITATPLDSIFSESLLKSSDIIRLNINDNYYGLDKLNVNILKHNINAYNKILLFKDILKKDKNIIPFLNMFKCLPLNADGIPNICLMKFTRLQKSQENVYNGIIKNYNKHFAVIIQNSAGIKLYHHTLSPALPFSKYSSEFQISEILQFLFDNGGIDVFPRIIIISGDMAGRSVSYVSSNYKWHLTDMYYIPSKKTPTNELEQNVSRLAGVYYNGASRLVLHTTSSIAKDTWRSHLVIKEIISRGIENPMYDDGIELAFSETFKSIKISKDKIPGPGRKLTSRTKLSKNKMFRKVKEDDGWDQTLYNHTHTTTFIPTNLDPTDLETTNLDLTDLDPTNLDPTELEKAKPNYVNGVNPLNIKKWINKDCIVGKIIMFLYNQSEPVDMEKLKTGIHYKSSSKMFKNNILSGCSIKSNYGKLWSFTSGKILLNKNIKEYIRVVQE